MAQTFYLSNGGAPAGYTGASGADFTKGLRSDTPGAQAIAVSVAGEATETSFVITDAISTTLATATGDWTVGINVQTANMNVSLSVDVERIQADGTVVEGPQTIGDFGALSATGDATVGPTSLSWSNSGSTTDYYRFRYIFTNSKMTAEAVTINAEVTGAVHTFPDFTSSSSSSRSSSSSSISSSSSSQSSSSQSSSSSSQSSSSSSSSSSQSSSSSSSSRSSSSSSRSSSSQSSSSSESSSSRSSSSRSSSSSSSSQSSSSSSSSESSSSRSSSSRSSSSRSSSSSSSSQSSSSSSSSRSSSSSSSSQSSSSSSSSRSSSSSSRSSSSSSEFVSSSSSRSSSSSLAAGTVPKPFTDSELYVLRLLGPSSPADCIADRAFTPFGDFIWGTYIRFANVEPTYPGSFWRGSVDGSIQIAIELDVNGDLNLLDSSGSVVGTAYSPLVADTWHRLELRWQVRNSGEADLWIDGQPAISVTGQDFLSQPGDVAMEFCGVAGTILYVGSFYNFRGGSSTDDFLGTYEVIGPYQKSQYPYATPDFGDDLSSGVWDDAGNTPADAAIITYDGIAEGGVTTFDGPRSGPDGDTRIDGDDNIKAGKWVYDVSYTGTYPILKYGKTSEPYADVDSTDSFAADAQDVNWIVSEDKSDTGPVPRADEVFQQGFGEQGTGTTEISEIWSFILHTPAPSSSSSSSRSSSSSSRSSSSSSKSSSSSSRSSSSSSSSQSSSSSSLSSSSSSSSESSSSSSRSSSSSSRSSSSSSESSSSSSVSSSSSSKSSSSSSESSSSSSVSSSSSSKSSSSSSRSSSSSSFSSSSKSSSSSSQSSSSSSSSRSSSSSSRSSSSSSSSQSSSSSSSSESSSSLSSSSSSRSSSSLSSSSSRSSSSSSLSSSSSSSSRSSSSQSSSSSSQSSSSSSSRSSSTGLSSSSSRSSSQSSSSSSQSSSSSLSSSSSSRSSSSSSRSSSSSLSSSSLSSSSSFSSSSSRSSSSSGAGVAGRELINPTLLGGAALIIVDV